VLTGLEFDCVQDIACVDTYIGLSKTTPGQREINYFIVWTYAGYPLSDGRVYFAFFGIETFQVQDIACVDTYIGLSKTTPAQTIINYVVPSSTNSLGMSKRNQLLYSMDLCWISAVGWTSVFRVLWN
jgi:hypothetical protein